MPALWSQLAKYQAFTCWVLSDADAASAVRVCMYVRVLLLASVYIRNPGQTQSYVVDIRARRAIILFHPDSLNTV
jgi:hypothetical protein